MAGSSNDTVFITPSPENAGFPPYLDFTTLRTNAITYLGPITGKYWTDYNVHDPGITTLEVLMYAIVDLGYRVNLPIASLLSPGSAGTSATSGTAATSATSGTAGASGAAAGSNAGSGVAGASAASGAGTASGTRTVSVAQHHGAGRHGHSPVATSADGNFFTPAQVLGCNPTTVVDYRKLLMDLDEVRNAWLEPDQAKYNGLYHIYLETEKDEADFSTHGEWDKYKHSVRSQVKKTLHAFRNLCEDFGKIVFLQRVHIGVNIDIEVVPGTDTGVAYQALVAFLYDFFSPVPTFYTLGQLTANNVSLATVFEGRPYTGRPSHGFLLDAEMPVRPKGDMTISKSVLVQNLLTALSDSGIKTIRSLTLLDGNGNVMSSAGGKWEYPLPADSLSAFLLSVSTFRWFQNGQLLSTQLGSYNAVLVLNSLHSGKVIYPAGAPALDAPAPYGAPLAGLGDYYSIQNDFPQVYGIGVGGLPPSASVLRQSQAWQFKGYLLFFDQLLADYLSQLSNIRQVFSMTAPAGGSTSFGGDLTSVPDLNMLLRFPPTDAAGGATLLFPVATKDWTPLIAAKPAHQGAPGGTSPTTTTPVPAAKIDALSAYSFGSSVERDVALATVIVLFSSAQLTVQPFQLDNNQWKYYLAGTDNVFVLVSRNSFANQAGAMGEAATVLYIGKYKENYSLVSLGEIGSYTFNLAASGAAYYQYLQSILEDPQEYTDRRTAFVEHLLARFAETFTDYALLESGFAPIGTVEQNQLTVMQRFLSEWPVLSADRGKAFDLRLDGWNSYNTSGLEQRFKAYCGIDDLRRHYLCHFEVQKMDERFHIALTLAEEELFTCREPLKYDEAVPAVHSLFAALSDRDNYRVVHGTAAFGYWVELDFYGGLRARSVRIWPEEAGATAAIETLYRMLQQSPAKGDSVISEYQYRAQLLDDRDRPMRTAIDGFTHEREAFDYGVHHLGRINDQGLWTIDEGEEIGPLFPNSAAELSSNRWIDIDSFKIYPRQNVLGPGKVDRWSFEVLDQDNSFRFESTRDFDSETAAREACCQLLHFLCETQFYAIRQEHEDWFKIVIRVGDVIWAHGEPDYDSESSARERIPLMVSQARRHLYHLGVISRPHRWKFLFFMGMPERGSMLFESVRSFESQHDAMEAARDFHRAGPSWRWRHSEEGIYLEAETPDWTPGGESLICFHPGGNVPHLKYLLETKEGIYRLAAGDEELARRMVVPDETSKEGAYVYRLVDKDHPWAFHPGGRHETRAEAETVREELISRAAQGYVYLEISLGDDDIRTALTPAGAQKFYYRLKCRNDYFSQIGVPAHGGKLTLFESVEAYDDADSAHAAFLQNYLTVLEKAGHPDNYGEKRTIALTDRDSIVTGDDHSPVVLVPYETREALLQAGLDVVGELVRAALSHPIRLAEHSTRYRFVLGHEGITDWNSARDYATAGDAQAAFDFFYLLLNFPGNFFVEFDWAACKYRIGIREVLAESTHRFHDEEDAWGPRGVEKFICVAQHEDGIHLNRRHDCTYSWFVACPNQKAMHPCTYESAAQRDRALHQLIQKAGYFFADGWIDQPDVHHFRLLDGRGHPLARVPMPSPVSAEHILNRILDIEDAIWAGRRPGHYGSGIQLIVGDGADAFAITPAENWSEKEWTRRLTEVTTYFPVTREGTVQAGTIVYSYRMEMKLPGFEDPPSPESSKDCGCPPPPEGEQPFCYLAWEDARTFTQATLAWEAWLELLPVIAEKENYRPVFGEQIGCYGIELHYRHEIIARAPQYYSYPAMAVDSATRARAHIDSEGLDIVEHLLLRPERSDLAIPVCAHHGPCASVWTQAPAAPSGMDDSGADDSGADDSGTDDSGATGTNVTGMPAGFPFVAGADPYSFIVTVALPAWPARFRTTENRVLLESIVQREMPAHILARILWLTPRDMCRFEHLYAGWIDGLAREATDREVCAAFKAGEFFQFLFDHALACLGDCRECGEEPQVTESSDDGEWLSEINHLYCWTDRQCAEKWKPEKPQPQPQEVPAIGSTSPAGESTEIIEVIVEVEPEREMPERETREREETVRETPVRDEGRPREEEIREREAARSGERGSKRGTPAPDARKIRKLLNDRRTRYEQKIADWQTLSGEEKPAENVRAFLQDPLPATRRLEDILKEIFRKNGKRAARTGHQQELAAIVLSIYLDRIAMQADEEARWEHLRSAIKKSGIRIADAEHFYQEWKPDEMRQLAPEIDEEKVRSIMREAAKS